MKVLKRREKVVQVYETKFKQFAPDFCKEQIEWLDGRLNRWFDSEETILTRDLFYRLEMRAWMEPYLTPSERGGTEEFWNDQLSVGRMDNAETILMAMVLDYYGTSCWEEPIKCNDGEWRFDRVYLRIMSDRLRSFYDKLLTIAWRKRFSPWSFDGDDWHFMHKGGKRLYDIWD